MVKSHPFMLTVLVSNSNKLPFNQICSGKLRLPNSFWVPRLFPNSFWVPRLFPNSFRRRHFIIILLENIKKPEKLLSSELWTSFRSQVWNSKKWCCELWMRMKRSLCERSATLSIVSDQLVQSDSREGCFDVLDKGDVWISMRSQPRFHRREHKLTRI